MAVTDKPAGEPMDQARIKLELEYYTDPLCCWSWAFEPQWRRLRYEYSAWINWQYIVGGMVVDWKFYSDPVNDIHRPSQMGPLWNEAKHLSGMPINDRIWVENPPKSSYPACLAVKAASLQGKEAEERFLRRVREAVMTNMMDISDREVLLFLARQLAENEPRGLDYVRFRKDLAGKRALDLLKHDLRKVKIQGISRYPSIVIKAKGRRGIIITGYRPYAVIEKAMREIIPELEPLKEINLRDYKGQWPNLTEREIEEVCPEGIKNCLQENST